MIPNVEFPLCRSACQRHSTKLSNVENCWVNFRANIAIYCDRHTDGGGWIALQRRQDGSVDFYRDWKSYKEGFGDVSGEFWLGLDNIHYLTLPSVDEWELRIDMTFANGEKHYVTYSHFRVSSEADKYRLHISGFSSPTLRDNMAGHNNMAFSTKGQDNDNYSGSCAQANQGAWWYNACHLSNLNGQYRSHGTGPEYNSWYHNLQFQVVKFVEMKIRRI